MVRCLLSFVACLFSSIFLEILLRENFKRPPFVISYPSAFQVHVTLRKNYLERQKDQMTHAGNKKVEM